MSGSQKGGAYNASTAFYNLKNVENEKEKQATRTALLEYCGLDTLAMVRILESLENVITNIHYLIVSKSK